MDSFPPAPILIPCISGTCQVPLHNPAARAPLKPTLPAPVDAPVPHALAEAEHEP